MITDRARLAGALTPGFDILISNAVVAAAIGRTADVSLKAFSACLETNLTSQYAAIHLALPPMPARGRGTIVNISSGAAHRPQAAVGLAPLGQATNMSAIEQGDPR